MKNLFFILLSTVIWTNSVCLGQSQIMGRAGEDYLVLSKYNKIEDVKDADLIAFNTHYGFTKEALDSLIKILKPSNNSNKTSNANADILGPTIVTDALGTFVANRMKEEANIAYLNKFVEFIEDTNFLELHILFPSTKDELLLVKDKVYDYKNYFPTLRSQFIEDFNNLPSSFVSVFENKNTFKETFLKGKLTDGRKTYLAFLFDVGDNISRGSKPLNFIESIRDKQYLESLNDSDSVKKWIYLITDFAFHLNKEGNINLKNVVSSNLNINCFIELLLHSKSNKSDKLETLIKDNSKRKNLESILIAYKEMIHFEDPNGNKQNENRNRVIQFSKIAENAISIVDINSKYKKDLQSTIRVVKGIVSKDYGSAISSAVTLMDSWKCENCDDDKEQNKFIAKFNKYGTFMANIINAKDGEDMLVALNAAALPVRSYQMKRNHTFTWSIGALGGVSKRIPFTSENESSSFGISAPVGIDFSFGTNKNNLFFRKGTNWGISVPIIDVSAVTAARLLGNKDVLPELTWNNIWSPGIFLNYGIRKQPITISLGFQKGAGLVKIEDSKAIIGSREYRFIIGASFDIPMFKILSRD